MKKIILYTFLLAAAFSWTGCKKTSNYPGGRISEYIPLYDLRNLYKGADVKLTIDNMYGADQVTGLVVSDYSGNNMPAGNYLILQDHRRLSLLRGIAIPLGADAAKYASGDSVSVKIAGGTLTRANGMLQITGIQASAVTKYSSNNTIPVNRVASSAILNSPADYESTLVAIVKGGFDPVPTAADKVGGDKMVNDGFSNITLHTEAAANFAGVQLPVSANYFGIVFNSNNPDGSLNPQVRMRKADDIKILSATLNVIPAVISGFINDVKGTDANYEYIQFLATQDIDFSVTPYSVVTTNNAGASDPAGYPTNGWATGGLRTYKFSLTTGKVSKGQFFYVGGTTKMINGSASTSMATSAWIRAFNYSTTAGDGFGTKTTNLLANSGNAFGVAIFIGGEVTKDSTPIDAIFVGSGGQLFSAGPPGVGYRIPNSDFYDIINPITLDQQPFYRQGTNTINLAYDSAAQVDGGWYFKLSGSYNPRLGRWTQARVETLVQLAKDSPVSQIEAEYPAGVQATQLGK